MTNPRGTAACPRCGVFLPPDFGPRRGRRRIWCSDRCRRDAHAERAAAARIDQPIRVVEIPRAAPPLIKPDSVLGSNPVRDVQPVRSKRQPKGAVALTAEQLRDLLVKLRASAFCEKHDLADPITLLIATGLRRSELLGLRWIDYEVKAGVLTITGKVIRVPGQGLLRVEETKPAAGRRTIPLPRFAIDMLREPPESAIPGRSRGHLPLDHGNPSRPEQLRQGVAHCEAGVGGRRSDHPQLPQDVATLIDDEGLSARIGADHLGHTHVSMTQDRYMTRGRIHTQVADLLDRTVRINDE
jgi:integrase